MFQNSQKKIDMRQVSKLLLQRLISSYFLMYDLSNFDNKSSQNASTYTNGFINVYNSFFFFFWLF